MLMRKNPSPKTQPVRSGFTLLEILIVVAIIVMLAGAGGYYLLQRYEEAKISTARTNVKTLAQAVEQYMLNHDAPASIEDLARPSADTGSVFIQPEHTKDPWGKVYQLDMSNPVKPIVWTTAPNGTRIASSGQ